MKPTKFKEVNAVLMRPTDMSAEECSSLSVYQDGDQCISRWELSWGERFTLFFRGVIWMGIRSGVTQPAAWLSIEKTPFEEE